MQTTRIELDRLDLFALTAGRGTPVIFMHGITGNAHVFEPIVAALQDTCHAVSIDQRGHGRSGRPSGYTGADFAADVAALVAHLGEGPAILVGHSLGARNAYEAGVACPQHVRGIVGVDFTPYIEPEVLEQLAQRVGGGDRLFESVEAIKRYLANRYPLLPPDAIDRRARWGYREVDGGWRPLADATAMRETAEGLKADLEGTLRRLAVPTVLVRGRQSRLVSETAWERTLALRPDLPAIQLDDCDHYVPEVQARALATIIRNAIERLR